MADERDRRRSGDKIAGDKPEARPWDETGREPLGRLLLLCHEGVKQRFIFCEGRAMVAVGLLELAGEDVGAGLPQGYQPAKLLKRFS